MSNAHYKLMLAGHFQGSASHSCDALSTQETKQSPRAEGHGIHMRNPQSLWIREAPLRHPRASSSAATGDLQPWGCSQLSNWPQKHRINKVINKINKALTFWTFFFLFKSIKPATKWQAPGVWFLCGQVIPSADVAKLSCHILGSIWYWLLSGTDTGLHRTFIWLRNLYDPNFILLAAS